MELTVSVVTCKTKANQTSNYVPRQLGHISELAKPILVQLSSDELLSKCLDGKTQNQNESINGTIWNRIPKNIFSDLVFWSLVSAVKIFKQVNLDPGEYSFLGMRKLNEEQIAKADCKGKEVNKKKRKMLQGLKKKGDKLKQKEGTLYQPGAF